MTESFRRLRAHLCALTVAEVTHTVAKDESLIWFEGKHGETVWHDYPDFAAQRREYTFAEWPGVLKAYDHYFGFAEFEIVSDNVRTVYFQKSTYDESDYFGFGINHPTDEKLTPPERKSFIVGNSVVVPGKGHRMTRWIKASRPEIWIHSALLNGSKLDEETLRLMEDTPKIGGHLANFARLIVNGDIEFYLQHKRDDKAGNPAEQYTRRCQLDDTVYHTTHVLRPELWEKYREQSLAEKLYSSLVRGPAPKPITDNLNGFGDSPGLSTPFVGLQIK